MAAIFEPGGEQAGSLAKLAKGEKPPMIAASLEFGGTAPRAALLPSPGGEGPGMRAIGACFQMVEIVLGSALIPSPSPAGEGSHARFFSSQCRADG